MWERIALGALVSAAVCWLAWSWVTPTFAVTVAVVLFVAIFSGALHDREWLRGSRDRP